MDNADIERILKQIEALLELHGENPFKSRAYGRAARSIRASGVNVAKTLERGEELDIEGVGTAILGELQDIVQTGTTRQLDSLLEETPDGLLDVLKIRGIGPKKVRRLWKELGAESLADLQRMGEDGAIAGLKGFGKKSAENILKGVAEMQARVGMMRLDAAGLYASRIVDLLDSLPSVHRVEQTGRLRRGAETLDRIDLIVETDDPERLAEDVEESGLLSDLKRSKTSIDGIYDQSYRVRVHLTDSASFPILWHTTTGSSDYRFMISIPLEENGYVLGHDRLTKDQKVVDVSSEEELFKLAGADYIPPELREGMDEVRLALDHDVPMLVEIDDLRGVVHTHSQWSDGRNTIREMANAALQKGYEYLLVSDHSKAAFYANGLDESRLEEQAEEIAEIQREFDPEVFRILHGIECDILVDGRLDLADDALAALDCVIVAVHSNFNLSEEEQTARVCRALENPHASILAHPTGRLLLNRDGYPIDLKAVIEQASECGKSIEVNANPYRLDLDWRMLRVARRKGVPTSICPDAHSMADIDLVRYGIVMARKAGLTAEDVLNTLPVDEFLSAMNR